MSSTYFYCVNQWIDKSSFLSQMRAVDFSSQVCTAYLSSQSAYSALCLWVLGHVSDVSHTYFVTSFWSHLYLTLGLGLKKFGLNIAHGGWEY